MLAKPKTAKRKHSNEIILVIFVWHSAGKLHKKIANYIKIPKLTVTRILQRGSKNPNKPYHKTKHVAQSTKLNAWSQRALICHIERFLHDNFAALSTSFKSGHTLSRETVQSYLKIARYLRVTACRKLCLTRKHKEAKLRSAQKHVD